MKARMDALAPMLQKLGLSPQRFRVAYISAAEGLNFAELMKEMANQLQELGPDKIKNENSKLIPIFERMLSKKKIRKSS
jgi:coenzyme F420-reducing hydrogenase delta subunit